MAKTLRERAEATAAEIQDILGVNHEDHPAEIADAIENSIIRALVDERNRCADVAKNYLDHDREEARKLSEEISRVNSVLITNLSAMR